MMSRSNGRRSSLYEYVNVCIAIDWIYTHFNSFYLLYLGNVSKDFVQSESSNAFYSCICIRSLDGERSDDKKL